MTPTEKSLKEAIKELRRTVRQTRQYARAGAKKNTANSYLEAARLNEFASGINFTLDNLEEYIKNGRML